MNSVIGQCPICQGNTGSHTAALPKAVIHQSRGILRWPLLPAFGRATAFYRDLVRCEGKINRVGEELGILVSQLSQPFGRCQSGRWAMRLAKRRAGQPHFG